MVRTTIVLSGINHKRSHFIDSLRLYVKGGTGGTGFPRLGGVGGKGGDIYVRAKEHLTLKHVLSSYPSKRIIGKSGEDSVKHRILGRSGANITIDVPIGINVMTDQQRCIGALDRVGQSVLVARGGSGGDQWNQYHGQSGQAHSINLDLKIIADIGFVGFPNAGKSTLLKALSRASPKIANYPFTTLRPNIGMMTYDDLRQISLADLPGLIEGAHLNYGLGHRFLKHVERTKMLLFVVDIQGFKLEPKSRHRSPFETIMLLNRELELYEDCLVHRPAALVVTKMDTKDSEKKYERLLERIKDCQAECEKLPKNIRPSELVSFDAIIPVCSHTAHNIPELKTKLRFLLDFYADKERQDGSETYLQIIEKEKKEIAELPVLL